MALIQQTDTILENSTGKAYVGVRVQAFLGGIEQQLYSDDVGTPVSIVNTNSNGQYEFWISEGIYDLSFSLDGVPLGSGEYTLFYRARASALGVSPNDPNLGVFSGTIIPDGSSAKAALQAVEAATEGNASGSGFLPYFGAVGDGAANDTAALQSAISSAKNVKAGSGEFYAVSGVNIFDGQSFDGVGARAQAKAGSYVFSLTGFYAGVKNVYIADNTLSSGAAIRIGNGRFQYLDSVVVVNAGAGCLNMQGPTGNGLSNIHNVIAEQITGTGVNIGSSVFEMRASSIYMAGYIDYVAGLGKPRAGTVGWRHNSPLVGDLARGGHQFDKLNMISSETGYWLTDVELTSFSQIISDAQTGYGLIIDGASDEIIFDDYFCAVSRGIKISGTSSNIRFTNLNTKNIGQIPPWGQASWYGGVSTFYAVTLEDTAQVEIDGNSWKGDKRVSVSPTARLIVTGGRWFAGRNVSNVAAGSTVWLSEGGAFASPSDALFRVQQDGYLFRLIWNTDTAPGASQSYTATVQVNGSDTAMTLTISGAGTFNAETFGPVFVTKGQAVTIKLVTSAGASAGARHVINLQQLGV